MAECVERVHQDLICVSCLVTVEEAYEAKEAKEVQEGKEEEKEACEAKEACEVSTAQEILVSLSEVTLRKQRIHLSRCGLPVEYPPYAYTSSVAWDSQPAGWIRQKSLDGGPLPDCCPHSRREYYLF